MTLAVATRPAFALFLLFSCADSKSPDAPDAALTACARISPCCDVYHHIPEFVSTCHGYFGSSDSSESKCTAFLADRSRHVHPPFWRCIDGSDRDGCSRLASCCPRVGSDQQTTCKGYVGFGNDSQCAQLLSEYAECGRGDGGSAPP